MASDDHRSATGRGVVLRDVGHQCARHPRAGPGCLGTHRRTQRCGSRFGDHARCCSRCHPRRSRRCATPPAGSPTGRSATRTTSRCATPRTPWRVDAPTAPCARRFSPPTGPSWPRRCARSPRMICRINRRSVTTTAARCGCSPARARSGPAWAPNCWPANRFSPRPSRSWSR